MQYLSGYTPTKKAIGMIPSLFDRAEATGDVVGECWPTQDANVTHATIWQFLAHIRVPTVPQSEASEGTTLKLDDAASACSTLFWKEKGWANSWLGEREQAHLVVQPVHVRYNYVYTCMYISMYTM